MEDHPQTEDAPLADDARPDADLRGSVEDEPAEDRPEHLHPTSEAQEKTRFVGAPKSGGPEG